MHISEINKKMFNFLKNNIFLNCICILYLQIILDISQVSVEGLQALKPRNNILHPSALLKENNLSNSQISDTVETGRDNGGINLETSMVISQDEKNLDTTSWAVENIKFSVKDPV